MSSFLSINIDRPGFSLVNGQLFLCVAEDGSSLSEKLAFINLGCSSDLAHFGHSFDQLSHVGQINIGSSLLGLHIAHEG